MDISFLDSIVKSFCDKYPKCAENFSYTTLQSLASSALYSGENLTTEQVFTRMRENVKYQVDLMANELSKGLWMRDI